MYPFVPCLSRLSFGHASLSRGVCSFDCVAIFMCMGVRIEQSATSGRHDLLAAVDRLGGLRYVFSPFGIANGSTVAACNGTFAGVGWGQRVRRCAYCLSCLGNCSGRCYHRLQLTTASWVLRSFFVGMFSVEVGSLPAGLSHIQAQSVYAY